MHTKYFFYIDFKNSRNIFIIVSVGELHIIKFLFYRDHLMHKTYAMHNHMLKSKQIERRLWEVFASGVFNCEIKGEVESNLKTELVNQTVECPWSNSRPGSPCRRGWAGGVLGRRERWGILRLYCSWRR